MYQKAKILAAIIPALLFFNSNISIAQYTNEQRKDLYKEAQGYISIGKYVDGVETKPEKIFIDPKTGSYAYVNLKHWYLNLPRETYKVKLWKVNKDVHTHRDSYEVTVSKKANWMRFDLLFKETGEFVLEIRDARDLHVKDIPVSVGKMRVD